MQNTSARKLSKYIDELIELSLEDTQGWAVVVRLVNLAIRDYPRISLDRKIGWLDAVSKSRRHHDEVRRDLSVLIQQGTYPGTDTVMRWVENAMFMSDATKDAALMLLAGDGRYWKAQVLPTIQLAKYLEQTHFLYDGNHAVFRFFAMLVLRMKRVPSSSRYYKYCIYQLGSALYAMYHHKENGVFFDSLLTWVQRSRHEIRKDVYKIYTDFLKKEAQAHRVARRNAQKILGPATK